MWTITIRDLQFRRRQFAIAVVGTAFAFALALVLTGMSAGFRHEARSTVDAIGAGAWVVPKGVKGPFTSESTMPAALTRQIMGGGQAEPLVDFGGVVKLPAGDEVNVNVIGHSIGALGDPIWGRPGTSVPSGETVVDKRLGADQGDTITVASRRLRVVREMSDRTYFAGQPTIFVSLAEGQAIAFGGKPLATAFVTRGVPTQVP